MGTRQVVEVIEEQQANGKTFQKLILGEYEWLNYLQINAIILKILNGLLSLNLKKGQHLVIYAETRMEWMATAIACFKGGFPSKNGLKIKIISLFSCNSLSNIRRRSYSICNG